MNIPTIISEKLQIVKDFQTKYPTMHIGGSIGLYIRGVDLKRELNLSDLDFTIDEYNKDEKNILLDERSDTGDFDFAYKITTNNGRYTKIDIRVCPEPSFDVIEFEGQKYNVSKLRDILYWKQKYANKGVKKHEYDLITIKTGVRPIEKESNPFDDDWLPF